MLCCNRAKPAPKHDLDKGAVLYYDTNGGGKLVNYGSYDVEVTVP